MEPFPRPERGEAIDYFFTYIDQVPAGDIREILATQTDDVLPLFESISEEKSDHRYAPDKWTIKEVLSHLNDTERVFTYRALWFARGMPAALPSMDQNIAIAGAAAGSRTWASHVEEFKAIRSATLALFRSLPDEAWSRKGIASDNPISVRALSYITAGHLVHHVRILRERYL